MHELHQITLVAKVKDVDKYLSNEERKTLLHLLEKVDQGRLDDGKPKIGGLFIQDTWPIHSQVESTLDAWLTTLYGK